MIVDKHTRKTVTDAPRLGELVRTVQGTGTYLGRRSACHYLVQIGSESKLVPAGTCVRTGQMNTRFLDDLQKNLSEGIKRKGGIRLGARRIKRNPADLKLRRKTQMQKTAAASNPPGDAADETSKHLAEDSTEEVACLGCGKVMPKPRYDTPEPFYCATCQGGKTLGKPLAHPPTCDKD